MPVITLTSAAANVSAISGGIVVFGDPCRATRSVSSSRARLRAGDRGRRPHAGAAARRRAGPLAAAVESVTARIAFARPPGSSDIGRCPSRVSVHAARQTARSPSSERPAAAGSTRSCVPQRTVKGQAIRSRPSGWWPSRSPAQASCGKALGARPSCADLVRPPTPGRCAHGRDVHRAEGQRAARRRWRRCARRTAPAVAPSPGREFKTVAWPNRISRGVLRPAGRDGRHRRAPVPRAASSRRDPAAQRVPHQVRAALAPRRRSRPRARRLSAGTVGWPSSAGDSPNPGRLERRSRRGGPRSRGRTGSQSCQEDPIP